MEFETLLVLIRHNELRGLSLARAGIVLFLFTRASLLPALLEYNGSSRSAKQS